MPRKTGITVSTFPPGSDIVTLNTNITSKLDVLSEDITKLEGTNEETLTELGRIRRANELILGQEVEESD